MYKLTETNLNWLAQIRHLGDSFDHHEALETFGDLNLDHVIRTLK
jgi:hypothetical protein